MSRTSHPIRRWLGRLSSFGAERSEPLVADLQSELTRLESVVTSMRDGVLVTDEEGLIRLVNPAFCRMFGITGEVQGASASLRTRSPASSSVSTGWTKAAHGAKAAPAWVSAIRP